MRLRIGPFTKILLGLNIAVAVITLWPAAYKALVLAGGLFPGRFVDGDAPFSGVAFLLPVWLTPISSAFLHGGLLHLGFNMMLLLLVGGMVEQILGWKGMLALYVAGIISSATAEIIVSPHSLSPVIGASGAVSAVLAAYLLLFPNAPPKDWGKMPAKYARPLQLLLMWVLINLAMGFAGPVMGASIAIYAHIGGFLAGLLLTRPLLLWKYRGA
jgi:membrane associated rhomboid family serine protease